MACKHRSGNGDEFADTAASDRQGAMKDAILQHAGSPVLQSPPEMCRTPEPSHQDTAVVPQATPLLRHAVCVLTRSALSQSIATPHPRSNLQLLGKRTLAWHRKCRGKCGSCHAVRMAPAAAGQPVDRRFHQCNHMQRRCDTEKLAGLSAAVPQSDSKQLSLSSNGQQLTAGVYAGQCRAGHGGQIRPLCSQPFRWATGQT